jgi:hypothetical protein
MALSQISKLMFGDEEVTLKMPSSMLRTGKTFVPVESKHRGYWVLVKNQRVIVTRRNPWLLTIAGFPPLYRFVGRLPELRQVGDTVSVSGAVTMRPMEKVFLSVWFGLLLIFLAFCFVWAILLASRVMFFSSITDDLAAIGFMLGGGGLVAAFGIVILMMIRLISKGQRKKLIAFCDNYSTITHRSVI